ncbi:hypothetical protein SAMN05216296_3257 [Pseudomonas pohangensis]|uniref:Transporter n=1 Tax=Pseudomonas pohangensis TaxID=364197 RepID=A0A1H2HTM0_9PSED|nr:hypothetical protein SAMN05216296_3257 [Pseudomonas pohangensis]
MFLHQLCLCGILPVLAPLPAGPQDEPLQRIAGISVLPLLTALWPLFALIVGGFCLRRVNFPSEAFWPGAERINYFILFPALLFSSLARAPLDNPALPRLALAVLLGLGLAWLVLLLLRRWLRWPAARFGVFTQGSLRFNTYLGLAAIGSLYGAEGMTLAALLLALLVPAVNVLSVWSLSADHAVSPGRLVLPILRNPLILACVAGILCNLSGFAMDGGSERLLGLLAAASLPLGLLCVGAALKPEELGGELFALFGNSLLRLLGMPLLAWCVAYGLQLPPLERTLMVLFFALPTAPTAYVLTRQLDGDSHLMAGIITLQTLLAALSLPLLLTLLAY